MEMIVSGMTIDEAAEVMKVSRDAIRRQIRRGRLTCKVVPGKFGAEYRIDGPPGLVSGAIAKEERHVLENISAQPTTDQRRQRR